MKNLLLLLIVIVVGYFCYQYFGYQYFGSEESSPAIINTVDNENLVDSTPVADTTVFTEDELNDIPATYNESVPIASVQTPVSSTTSFTCDGRQQCSQMTSCAEATYFSNNCPNTRMDGNNDGVPCEQQWCH